MDKIDNDEMARLVVQHINLIYEGSVPRYCAANNINYSGMCKALRKKRGFSTEQVRPLLYKKQRFTYFVKE